MTKYLSTDMVCRSFKRLSSRKKVGKTHLERTSVLMYFLAFDAACKFFDVADLDLNPDSLEGKDNRKQVEVEYTKLTLLEKTRDDFKQVTELGKIDVGGTTPEKRISSNFFTVPLKKASGQKEPYFYPKRPAAPLLKMGPAATGKKWGITHSDDWASNLPVLISEIKEPTPFLDLALFVCRDCGFDDKFNDGISAISDQLQKRFTKNLADFWVARIEKEKVLARHMDSPFADHHSFFAKSYAVDASGTNGYDKMKKGELIERITYLEEILGKNGIEY
jgi:hypothetical protein